MKLRYLYTLLTLVTVFYFTPANAQHKKSIKKPAKTAVKKARAKKVEKKSAEKKPASQKPAAATTVTDTTKKNQPPAGSLAEEIIINTSYKPVLADAVKIRRNPDLSDKTPFKAPLTYITLDKRLERNTDIKQLDAMKMPKELDSIPSNNYAKLGLGNLKTTYGEIYVNNGQDEALQVGAYAKHIAQSGQNIYRQNDDRDEVGVFGKATGDENAFNGRIDYQRHGTYFYGYDPANPPSSFNPLAQHFNTISGEAEVKKNYKDIPNDFTYAFKADGYIWDNAFQAKESNLVVSGFLNETINQFYAGLNASLDLSTQKDSLYSYNNSILRLNPYLKFQGDNYKIDAGVNIAKEFGFSSRIFIFPAAKLEFQVVPKYVRLFAEVRGDVNKSSLKDFTDINPFLEPNINIINSVDKLDLSAGLKGTIAPGLGFKGTIFRNSVKNLPMFVSDFNNTFNKFGVIYDDGNAIVTGFNGELDYRASDDFDLFGRAEFRNYQLASQPEAWNLPKFKLTAGTTIHLTKQLSINGTLLYRGNTYDRTFSAPLTIGQPPVENIVSISGFADLSGGVEYKINSRISIFGQVNNILNTTNQVWLYYPNYGFNIFGGIGVHF
ncbi:MAG TPA: hypothetical protein VHE59_15380 [Mucilaginibacter sp.]|nr:hypothetical protein [Mucilaginibacter sp.]